MRPVWSLEVLLVPCLRGSGSGMSTPRVRSYDSTAGSAGWGLSSPGERMRQERPKWLRQLDAQVALEVTRRRRRRQTARLLRRCRLRRQGSMAPEVTHVLG